mmetsp:Transcript_24170/g.52953  ORF Transcript_24170/g.52953 Transcript_24170/m.52953 type:complete len:191 (-) Transcript_24170:10-582(-)
MVLLYTRCSSSSKTIHQPLKTCRCCNQQQHQLQQQQQRPLQPLQMGSLSIIDGTNEEEMHSLNDSNSNSNSCNLTGCSGTASAASASTTPVTSPTTAVHNHNSSNNDDDDALLVDRHLNKLRDSIQSSTTSLFPNKSIEAIESLLDFVASIVEPGATLDRFIEQGAVTILVTAMGNHRGIGSLRRGSRTI